MPYPIIRIHDIETDSIIDREMNEEEYNSYLLMVKSMEDQKATEVIKSEAKTELLERLGITAEEAALLLG